MLRGVRVTTVGIALNQPVGDPGQYDSGHRSSSGVNTPEPFAWLLRVAGIACMLTYAAMTLDRWRAETDG